MRSNTFINQCKLVLMKSIHETERCILEIQNQNYIFQELKLFNMKVIKYFVCV